MASSSAGATTSKGSAFSLLSVPERRVAFQAVIVGAIVWGAVYTLRLAVHELFHRIMAVVESMPTVLVLVVPLVLGALLEVAVIWYRHTYVHYRDDKGSVHRLVDAEGDGLERAIALYYASEPSLEQVLLGQEGVDVRWEMPTFSLAVRKWLATLMTLGTGRSGGLEGSVALVGESVAASLFKPRQVTSAGARKSLWEWWRVTSPDELQTLQIAGIAAAFSTLLGAPFAAAFFAIEVVYRRRPVVDKLLYALIASLTAYFLSHWMQPQHTQLFAFASVPAPALDIRYLVALLAMIVAVLVVTRLFASMRAWVSISSRRAFPSMWLRHVVGALATAAIALLIYWTTGSQLDLVLSTGQEAVEEALRGNLLLVTLFAALIGKLLATAFTVGTGGSSGLLIPAVYLGAMCGAIVANLGGFLPVHLMAPAIAASLVAMVNVPLAAILLTLELFGTSYILPSLLALIVVLLVGRNVTIYRTQRQNDTSRELLPGYEVRRIPVPPSWDQQSLNSLRLRAKYDLNVIGQVLNDGKGTTQVRPDVPSQQPLHSGQLLLVLGKSEEFSRLTFDLEAEAAAATQAKEASDKESIATDE